jgi:2-methylcitrate dehydratase
VHGPPAAFRGRRQALRLAAAAIAFPWVSRGARAQTSPKEPAPPETQPLAERLAAYADTLTFDDIDAATLERVKAHVIDTMGCGMAAFDEEPVRKCRDVALSPGAGAATVIGTRRQTTPDLASFANGAAFRYYDLNDVYVGRAACHPSDNIAACLAVGEAQRASAAEVITAIALAYEINCRLIDTIDLETRGWDGATIFSLPAVALASGKLMKLPRDKLAQAVALALNDHIPMGQTRAQALSDWKGFADAEAARNAVFAAMLARAGVSGPAPIFEGRRGFFQLVSGPADIDVSTFGRRGIPFRIHQCGMKAYPVVVFGQTAVAAGVAVAKEVGDLDRITAIEVATTPAGFQSAGKDPEKWTPENRETADHSLPYIVARAMVDGDIGNESYAPSQLHDPRIRAFMRKITVTADSAFTPPRGSAPPTRISATLADGRRVTRQVDTLPGFAGQPMGRADVERKFRGNVGRRWSREQTDQRLEALWGFEQAGEVHSVLALLAA